MGMKWAHFITIGMNNTFHYGQMFIYVKRIHFNLIGMKWVNFIPNIMNMALHSSLNDQFIPTEIKWTHSVPLTKIKPPAEAG